MRVQKKVAVKVGLHIKAQEATPSPPVGPALGQHGVNIMSFCKRFNEESKHIEKGMIVPVVITIAPDKSFTFILKTPPAAVLILKALNLKQRCGTPISA